MGKEVLAAAICRPDNVVVALIGDGGLAMSLGELRILSELKSPVIVVVFRDDALELIRSKQRKRELLAYGTTFTGPKLSQIAAAYGLNFYRPTTVRQCASFTKMAIEGGRPALMEVLVDTAGYPTAA